MWGSARAAQKVGPKIREPLEIAAAALLLKVITLQGTTVLYPTKYSSSLG